MAIVVALEVSLPDAALLTELGGDPGVLVEALGFEPWRRERALEKRRCALRNKVVGGDVESTVCLLRCCLNATRCCRRALMDIFLEVVRCVIRDPLRFGLCATISGRYVRHHYLHWHHAEGVVCKLLVVRVICSYAWE